MDVLKGIRKLTKNVGLAIDLHRGAEFNLVSRVVQNVIAGWIRCKRVKGIWWAITNRKYDGLWSSQEEVSLRKVVVPS